MPERKEVKDKLSVSLGYDLEGPVEEVVNKLQELVRIYSHPKYFKYTLDWRPKPWDEGEELVLMGTRWETEEETTKRLIKTQEDLELRKKWDKEQYDRLKKQFGESK